MDRTMGQLQRLLPQLIAKLVTYAYAQGYELTFGEAWRSTATARLYAEQGKGIANSLHCDRLAVDFNLFKDGVYITEPAAYAALGAYWKTLDADARWGGDFHTVDADHFSLSFGGRE